MENVTKGFWEWWYPSWDSQPDKDSDNTVINCLLVHLIWRLPQLRKLCSILSVSSQAPCHSKRANVDVIFVGLIRRESPVVFGLICPLSAVNQSLPVICGGSVQCVLYRSIYGDPNTYWGHNTVLTKNQAPLHSGSPTWVLWPVQKW